MVVLDLAATSAQLDELEKIAGVGDFLRTPWGGRLVGAGIGAATGAGLGAATAPPEQRARRAVTGGILGGAAGMAGGQLATRAGRQEALQFGQRQLHGLTGYLPGRGVFGAKTEGLPKLTGEQRLKELKDLGFTVPKTKTREEAYRRARGKQSKSPWWQLLPERAQRFMASQKATQQMAQRKLMEEGMTSVPGMVKGYVGASPSKVSPLEAAKLNLLAPGAAMGIGLPALMTAQSGAELARTGDVRQFGRDVASNVGFAAAGGVPMGASLLVGSAAGKAGELAGAGVERLRGRAAAPVRRATPTRVTPVGQAVGRAMAGD